MFKFSPDTNKTTVAQGVSPLLPTVMVRVRSKVRLCKVSDNVLLGRIFLQYFGLPCHFSFQRLLRTHQLSGSGTMGPLILALSHEPKSLQCELVVQTSRDMATSSSIRGTEQGTRTSGPKCVILNHLSNNLFYNAQYVSVRPSPDSITAIHTIYVLTGRCQ